MQTKNLISIAEADYQALLKQLEAIQRQLDSLEPGANRFITNDKFIELMGISKRTAQSWRDNGIIAFCQIQNKIYYQSDDIEDFLKRNRKSSY